MLDIVKKEFIEKIKHLFGVELIDEPIGKPKRFVMRCEIESRAVLSYLAMNKIRYEKHRDNYYFIFVK